MPSLYFYSYANVSNSLKGLKKGLGGLIVKSENSNFKGNKNKNVIVWGNSKHNTEVNKCNVLNRPEAIKKSVNKLNFFRMSKDRINIPEFTTDMKEAHRMLLNSGCILSRSLLTGSSGRGIDVIDNEQLWKEHNPNNVKMYVNYIPKISEWRVHVFKGSVFDVQKKGHNHSLQPNSYKIRNTDNGFIYLRKFSDKVPEGVIEQAEDAMKISGLDFGAVDVIYNKYRNKAYVLEINAAPGLEVTTLRKYLKVFGEHFGLDVKSVPEVRATDNVAEPAIGENLMSPREIEIERILDDSLERAF